MTGSGTLDDHRCSPPASATCRYSWQTPKERLNEPHSGVPETFAQAYKLLVLFCFKNASAQHELFRLKGLVCVTRYHAPPRPIIFAPWTNSARHRANDASKKMSSHQ